MIRMFAIVERRDAQVLPLADSHDHVADDAAPAVDHHGQRLRRQDRRLPRCCRGLRPRPASPSNSRRSLRLDRGQHQDFSPTVEYTNEVQAREDVRTGRSTPAVIIPRRNIPARVYFAGRPVIGLVVDDTDPFTSGSIEAEMQLVVSALTARSSSPPGQSDRPGNCRALSLRQLHEVFAPRHHLPWPCIFR